MILYKGFLNPSNGLSIEYLECIQDNFLEQIVHEQTRGQNCLDLVLTNHSNIVKKIKILAPTGNSIDVTSGMPQGSVLGLLLFILYANDLELGINCKVYKFADDTKVAVRVRNW